MSHKYEKNLKNALNENSSVERKKNIFKGVRMVNSVLRTSSTSTLQECQIPDIKQTVHFGVKATYDENLNIHTFKKRKRKTGH